MLTLRELYNFPLRATNGFVKSIFSILDISHILIPDYTTLSRRQAKLEIDISQDIILSDKKTHIAIDSTGVKIFGDGEWKTKVHGTSKRRKLLKLHVGINTNNHIIEAAVVTDSSTHDSKVVCDLLEQIEKPIEKVYADGAYDNHNNIDSIEKIGAEPVIPSRKNAVITQHGNSKSKPIARDKNIRGIRDKGRKKWKEETGYHKRSLVETTMFRIKQIFSPKIKNRTFKNQPVEILLICKILNILTKLGMPNYAYG